MQWQQLKGRRVASGYRQSDSAKAMNMTEKTLSLKEGSDTCKFSVNEIKTMAKLYSLSVHDVNEIFFDNDLPNGNKTA